MTRERCVIRFYVHANFILQTKLREKTVDGGDIVIVLMFGWLLRCGFDQQSTLESGLVLVLDNHVEKAPKLVAFALEVGVQQRVIPFTSTPQHVVFATQTMRPLQCLKNLRGRESKRFGIGARCGARRISRM